MILISLPGTPCQARKGQILLPVVVDIQTRDHLANTQTMEEAFRFVRCREMLQVDGHSERRAGFALHLACCNLKGHRKTAQPLEVCLELVSKQHSPVDHRSIVSYPLHDLRTRDGMEPPVD